MVTFGTESLGVYCCQSGVELLCRFDNESQSVKSGKYTYKDPNDFLIT